MTALADYLRRPRKPGGGRRRVALAVCFLTTVVPVGCKSNKGGGGTNATPVAQGKQDPLFGGTRIPPQNVPVSDRGVGTRGRVDPLLGTPTGGKGGEKMSAADPAGDRWKGTFLPNEGSTNAALAGKFKADSSDLRIDAPDGNADPRLARDGGNTGGPVTLTPAGGLLPPSTDAYGREKPPPAGPSADLGELQAFGLKAGDYELARSGNGEFVLTARVTNESGAKTQFTGVGGTAAEAVKQVVEQLKDRR